MNPTPRALLLLGSLCLLFAACVQQGGPTPNPTPTTGLSIGAPHEGQSLAGTIIAVAGGVGGAANDLTFTLGNLTVDARSDGTAVLNTRNIPDGQYDLQASATVAGHEVTDSVDVTVANDLPDAGQVGPEGGTLESEDGSYATLPPGALHENATLTLEDTTQQQILDEFGVDYPALGVTFLGSLTVDATGTTSDRTDLPVQVDLAGWAQAVQPQQDVVMFNVLPDADGDGIGELTFAASARATPDGSVVTLPAPRAEVYGVMASDGSLRLQQTGSVRPGQIVELQARGLTPQGALSNTARLGGGNEILVVANDLESGSFSPLQSVLVAVPALGQSQIRLTLVNHTTGFESERFTLGLGNLGSGNRESWDDFTTQLDTVIERFASNLPELGPLGSDLLAQLGGDATARAMVANSGLVAAANLALLETIDPAAPSAAQRYLVARHALLLDAMAISTSAVGAAGADLASLLLLVSSAVPSGGAGDIRRQQGGGSGCGGPSAPVFWGSPTGMGSAPPGSCAGGSGGGGGGGSSLRSQRLGGSVGPVAGAVVRALIPGSNDKIAPFTDVTDDSGYYYLPFLPPDEPVTIQAIDTVGGRVAEITTTTGGAGASITLPLVFIEAGNEQGAPSASFTATPDPGGTPGRFLFDASASSDPDGEIVEYLWDFGDGNDADDDDPLTEYGYVTAGTFTVSLAVIDDEGKVGTTSVTLPELAKVSDVDLVSGNEELQGLFASLTVPPAVSADGERVAFIASDQDSLSEWGVYLGDVATGELELVSVDGSGVFFPVIEYVNEPTGIGLDGDAGLIAFATETALVPDDINAGADIYLKDPVTGELRLVPVAPNGEQPAVPVLQPSLSDDGGLLAVMLGTTQNVGSISDITVTDLASGEVAWITEATNDQAHDPILSGDGAYLFYKSGQTIHRVELATMTSERVSETPDGTPIDAYQNRYGGGLYDVSRDGRFVVFLSSPSSCNNTCVLRKDMDTGEMVVVADTTDDFSFAVVNSSVGIGGEGRWIVFIAEVRPDPDRPTTRRGYVWDADSGSSVPFDLNQLGAEPAGPTREHVGISADGSSIVFMSAAKNYVPFLDDDSLPVYLYRTNNPLWEAP